MLLDSISRARAINLYHELYDTTVLFIGKIPEPSSGPQIVMAAMAAYISATLDCFYEAQRRDNGRDPTQPIGQVAGVPHDDFLEMFIAILRTTAIKGKGKIEVFAS